MEERHEFDYVYAHVYVIADSNFFKVVREHADYVDRLPEIEIATMAPMGRAASMVGDQVSSEDKLGRTILVDALAGVFMHTEEKVKGFTVALLGDWGSGKSTIIELLKGKLGELRSRRFDFATFDAWEYEHTENIAAGLAQEVVRGLIGKAGFWERQKLRVQFAFREHGWNLLRCIACLSVAAILPALSWLVTKIGGGASTFLQTFLGVGAVAILVPFTIYTYKGIKRVIEHPMAVKMQTYLKLPNYGKHLGLVPVLKRHIQTLCSLKLKCKLSREWVYVSGPFLQEVRMDKEPEVRKLVVFVDNLDRCKSECIASTLDAVRLVMDIENVIILIAIDHRIAFMAIEKHYRELEEKGEEKNSGKKGASYIARDYLGKIIHLPVRVLQPNPKELDEYINEKLFENAIEIEKKEGDLKIEYERPKGEEDAIGETGKIDHKGITTKENGIAKAYSLEELVLPEESVEEAPKDKEMRDTSEERDLFGKLVKSFGFRNPRQLLRMRNSYRMLKALDSNETYKRENVMRMLLWQEFLHDWPLEIRNRCMASLWDKETLNEIEDAKVGQVVGDMKESIVELYNKDTKPKELAQFVRTVVLPHREEGVLDTKEDVSKWLVSRKNTRTGVRWEKSEDSQLVKEFGQSLSIEKIANLHNRSKTAIKSRLKKLGKKV